MELELFYYVSNMEPSQGWGKNEIGRDTEMSDNHPHDKNSGDPVGLLSWRTHPFPVSSLFFLDPFLGIVEFISPM